MNPLLEAYAMAAFACITGAYVGALAFGAAGVAPLAVKLLPVDASATLLRAFWVRFHRFGVAGGVFVTIVCGSGSLFSALPLAYSALMATLAGLMTACLFVGLQLIPAINRARDERDARTFHRLHRLDVVLVGAGLLFGTLLVAGLVYALPGVYVHG